MFSKSILFASLALAGLIEGAAIGMPAESNLVARQGGEQRGGGGRGGQQGGQQGGGQQGNQQGGQTCLNNNLVQSASKLTGQEDGTEGIKPGQAPSAV